MVVVVGVVVVEVDVVVTVVVDVVGLTVEDILAVVVSTRVDCFALNEEN